MRSNSLLWFSYGLCLVCFVEGKALAKRKRRLEAEVDEAYVSESSGEDETLLSKSKKSKQVGNFIVEQVFHVLGSE